MPIDNSNRNSEGRHIGDCRRSIQISGLVVAVFFEGRETARGMGRSCWRSGFIYREKM
ncbi:hypothetical protein QUB56_14635 [Microcoleus sp. AR_TQ3_B6]|uniref:hypothetical protein n=1 Tax=Microcoleus sp. AR_TQ3_B6 TaxID=3055284 RepID=UPI002FD54CB8